MAGLWIYTTLNTDNDVVGVFGILFKVSLQKDQTVVIWWSVEITTVPKVGCWRKN
jgi:hypothetical protein